MQPLLLVKKKSDASGKPKFRVVIDFKALNEVTLNEFHPLPNITKILVQLRQCQLFSVIDFVSGLYQIPLSESFRYRIHRNYRITIVLNIYVNLKKIVYFVIIHVQKN
jgi:hypothetical protein